MSASDDSTRERRTLTMDPKIEMYESDRDEESATTSRMPLLPTTEASDDGTDGCDRRRERWRRRVRRAIATRWERGTVAEKSGKDESPPSAQTVASFVSQAGITNDLDLLGI